MRIQATISPMSKNPSSERHSRLATKLRSTRDEVAVRLRTDGSASGHHSVQPPCSIKKTRRAPSRHRLSPLPKPELGTPRLVQRVVRMQAVERGWWPARWKPIMTPRGLRSQAGSSCFCRISGCCRQSDCPSTAPRDSTIRNSVRGVPGPADDMMRTSGLTDVHLHREADHLG